MSDSYNTIKHSQYVVNEETGEIIGRNPRAGDEHGGAPVGLSTVHIRRKYGTVRIYKDGSLIEVSKNRLPKDCENESFKRGEITGFSRKSRMRLLKKMSTLQKTDRPLFITLTYPSEFPNDKEIYKADLAKFLKRLVYRFPATCGVWRLEFQNRGAPHYHLLVWGLPYHHRILFWISKIWYEVVGSGDKKHLDAGTQVQKIRSWRGVMSYASKYMAKTGDYGQNIGRVWGLFNRARLPVSEYIEVQVSQKTVVKIMRLMRKYSGIKSRDYPSLSIFVNNPERWLVCLGEYLGGHPFPKTGG